VWQWVVLFILGASLFGLLLGVATARGRTLGRRLLRWVYDKRTGQFEVRDDWKLWRAFIKKASIGSAEQLLDLGTQTGHLPRLVAQQRSFRGTATGVDWADDMIREAKRQARLEGTAGRTRFVCADVSQPLPFPDDAFTMVVCATGVLEGMQTPDRLLDDVRRVLRHDGRVVFSCPSRHPKLSEIHDSDWFSEQLPRFGFTAPRVVPWTATQNLVIACLRRKANPR
jgi:ubiquinone/menaquinone biosynthesis C-methylase UbiE